MTSAGAAARRRIVAGVALVLAVTLSAAACSDKADDAVAEPATTSSSGDRDTVFGLRLPSDAEVAPPRPAAASPLDPKLQVNQAYTAERPRDLSVHSVGEATTVATPMPFPHEAVHTATGSLPATGANR